MTAAVLRSSPHLGIPQTQNTAPVYEFNCLYTHDLRRKQKRWQDGFLRYHTFNKRVMVYDVPRNFLGDIHWTSGVELQEGDEMTLDKGAIMVQVAERVGRTETDISGLVQRKDRTPAKPTPPSITALKPRTPRSFAPPLSSRPNASAVQAQGKHKSLTALLGNSRRPIGKVSIPTESPFDLRQKAQENAEWGLGRERKRQKTETYVAGAARMPTSRPAQKPVTVSTKENTTLPASVSRRGPDIIDISSDTEDSLQTHRSDNVEAELLSTSSPSRLDSAANQPAAQPLQRHKPDLQTAESPSARTQQRIRTNAHLAPGTAPSERRVSTPMDVRPLDTTKPAGEGEFLQRSAPYSLESDLPKRAKSLKLVGGAPRKMLVFQARKPNDSSPAAGPEAERSRGTRKEKDLPPAREASKPDQMSTGTTYRQRMQERLAHLAKKQRSGRVSEAVEQVSDDGASAGTGARKSTPDQPPRPKASGHAREPTPDAPPPSHHHADPDISATEPANLRQDALPRPKPPPRDRLAKPRPRNLPPHVETPITTRPFRPPGVKEAAADGASKTTHQGAQEAAPDDVSSDSHDGRPSADAGPWSKEAFDLMDWRPPDRDVHGVKLTAAA